MPKLKELRVKALKVDRKKWLRNRGGVLYNGEKCCIIGCYLNQIFRIKKDNMFDRIVLDGIIKHKRIPLLMNEEGDGTNLFDEITMTNDRRNIKDKTRESKLKVLMKKLDVRLFFFGKG